MTPLLLTANIAGYLGILILYIQVVFGSRHVFSLFTKDTVFMNRVHKQIGIYGILLIFAHPLLEMMSRLENFLWIFIPDFSMKTSSFIGLGKIALILFLVVWVTSAIIREKIRYTPWKYIHLLAYPVLFLSLIHITYIGTLFESYFLIRVLWLCMVLSFVAVSLIRLLAYAGVLKNQATIVKKEMVGESILLLTLKPKENLADLIEIGQHIYLQSGAFKSEHPFTVMQNKKQEGEIVLGIRKLGGLWDELLLKGVGDFVLLDGPYGVFTREAQNTDRKVIISGGIGVTPFVDLVTSFGENTTYINCNRKIEEVVLRDFLRERVTTYVDIVDEYTGEDTSVIVGRISKEVLQSIIKDEVKSVPYFICGSPMFITIVRTMLLELGVSKKNIFFEELGF